MMEDPIHFSTIARHPSASLYDRFFVKALPEVAVVAARKNVHLGEGEAEHVLHYALKDIPRKTLELALQNNDKACRTTSFALDHALDVLAMVRLIMISDSLNQIPPRDDDALTNAAEDNLRQRFANDKALTCVVWRNPVEEISDFIRAVVIEQDKPILKLPDGGTSRTAVRGLAFSRLSHEKRP